MILEGNINKMEINNSDPQWMKDELVQNIPKEKLIFLKELFAEASNKDKKQLLSSIIPKIKEGNKKGLTLTGDEVQRAITAIKKYSSKEELDKIDNLLKNRTQ